MLLSVLKKYKYQLFLIGAVLAILYPLSLFIYIPKWDNINGYLPYRYFISDYLWNGALPLWNPFQNMGYPGYADLQSGVWSPTVWIIMLFGKYTINSLIVELLSCYVFAGLGMMKLANYLFKCKKTAFILGLSYALSGFMVGSAQLMVFLIAVTWFPWIIYGLLQFFRTYQLKYQLYTAFFMALFITGASPAYTIILAYIVLGMFFYHLVIQRKTAIKKIVKGGTIILMMLIVLLLPYINAFLEFVPYFNRAEGLAYDRFLLFNPFTPISYVSFLLPDAVIAKTDWFDITDLSLRNGYFGLIGLLGFASSFLSKFNRFKIILLSGFLFSLLLAAGGETIVFEWFYHLPGFGLFRHPSIFRAFTIFCGLLLAGNELKIILNKGIQKRHKLIFIGLSVLILGIGFWALTKTTFLEVKKLIINIYNYVEFSESALSTHLLLNVIIVITIAILVLLAKTIFKWNIFKAIVCFLFLDIGIHTTITIPTTVCYKITQSSMNQFFDDLSNEINQEDNYTPLKQLNETQSLIKTDGIWQNISTYNKMLSFVGVNPMRFKSFEKAEEDGRLEKALEHNILYVENSELKPSNIKVGYNTFSANIKTESKQKIILNQNYHHLWEASINGIEVEIIPYNNLTMQVEVPENTDGILKFEYKSPRTKYALLISLLGYAFVIVYLIKNRQQTNS